MLAIEFSELIDLLPTEGFDVTVTGFETPEIDLLFADMAASRNQPEETIPPLRRNAVTQRGDLWLLGRHRLLCADAQQTNPFARLINRVSAAAVFCDPPYNLRVSMIGGRGRIVAANTASPAQSKPKAEQGAAAWLGQTRDESGGLCPTNQIIQPMKVYQCRWSCPTTGEPAAHRGILERRCA